MLSKYLKEGDIDKQGKISNKNFKLRLKCYSNPKGVEHFLSKVCEARLSKIPSIHTFWVSPIKEMSIQSRKDLINLVSNVKFYSLDVLYLQGNDIDIDKFMPGLECLLRTVKKQIYLKGFMMSKDDFKKIIESSSQCQELIMVYCQVSPFDDTFEIDPNINFKLESLNLYGTCCKLNQEALNIPKMTYLVSTLSNTNLTETLKNVSVMERWYSSYSLGLLFNQYGFSLTVSGKNEEPKELK